MSLNKEDFPLYQRLEELNLPGIERAKRDFEAARQGGDAEKFQFALGIQTIAANVPLGTIPGVTREMNEKTLQSCLKIFKEVASHGDANAACMVDDFKARGLGEEKKSGLRRFLP